MCGACRLHFDDLASGVEPDARALADATPQPCPASYTAATTGCYRWSTAAVSKAAAVAEAVCEADAVGAHLAVISSIEENQVLTALQGAASSWIGLAKPGASFVWVTGDPLAYDHWAPGDPNGEGNCGRLLQAVGDWDDELCTKNQPFLCEVDGVVATVPPPGL